MNFKTMITAAALALGAMGTAASAVTISIDIDDGTTTNSFSVTGAYDSDTAGPGEGLSPRRQEPRRRPLQPR